jgi:hypothetical protein
MARFRRESHHSDGITDQISLQRTSATKSAQSGHSGPDDLEALCHTLEWSQRARL